MYSVECISEKLLSSRGEIIKITLSSVVEKSAEYKKIVLRPISLKAKPAWQAERFRDNKVFHLNIPENEAYIWFKENLGLYAQINIFASGETVTYSRTRSGEYSCKSGKNNLAQNTGEQQNNREKAYILKEGSNIPALVDLGVFTSDFKIVNSKYDKFRQINRFVEIIDDAYGDYRGEEITILDFGCGKSYLTFIVYYYFAEIKKVNVKIIGYDLKADVVENCNAIAQKYGYDNLKFVVSDVTRDVLYGEKIDMVISLHACDTATDYALGYAVAHGVKNIFSVPCCQHEVNLSIKKGGELDVFLDYGIIKERMSALLTDGIRAWILEDMGYSVDMLEFVDLAHSPKNIMIRAKKTKKSPNYRHKPEIEALMEKYSFKQSLYGLIYGKK